MNTVANRIQTILNETAKDQVWLASAAGASKSVVNQWLSGKIKTVNPKYAYSIEKSTGYLKEWVMFGTEPKRLSPSSEGKPPISEEKISDLATALGQQILDASPVVQGAIRALLLRYEENNGRGDETAKAIKTLLGMNHGDSTAG